MQALIVLGSLASVAMIIIWVVKNLDKKNGSDATQDDAVSRHHVTLSRDKVARLVEMLNSACEVKCETTVNLFISDDSVLQVTIEKVKK